ncbi:MAG: TIGR03619 family F420-dependent LLM class oxidoreductase [Porticoccaceae bacterium]
MLIGIARPMEPPHPIPDVDMAQIGMAAENAGFSWISYGHHTVRPLDEPVKGPHKFGVPLFQDQMVGFARTTAVTSTLEVGGMCVVPMHHPVTLAKMVGSIDHYSNGRLILGIGVGGASQQEIEASGGRWKRRWDYTREAVEIMKGLWTQERFEYDGEFFKIPPVLCRPSPARKPHPPLLLGGFSDQVLKRAAEWGDGWFPAYIGEELEHGPQRVVDGRRKIEEFANDVHREDKRFEIAAILVGNITRDIVRRFEDAGADRVAIMLPIITTAEEGRQAVEKIAEEILV